ncbi:hypothetical protein [Paludisphaera mucosa]|uniref:Uncharacterized protein n=1 Tax=Paludisphaera mucosa TaxID=3030827 RepID=A0ABT6FJD6_9BACT|nr:hypothetical protein [Paludisphaera mucosa]MDG3007686.1 hypothetical protein [Paludisphaera mucosa]
MSRNKDQSSSPHAHVPGRTGRRNRRGSTPSLTTLEDRKLMTQGFGAPMGMMAMAAPMPMFQAPTQAQAATPTASGDAGVTSAAVATTAAPVSTLSFQGDYTYQTSQAVSGRPAFGVDPGQGWIQQGADAQFGPTGPLALGGAAGVGWPTAATLPSFPGDPTSQPIAIDASTLPAQASDPSLAATSGLATTSATATDAATSQAAIDAAFAKQSTDMQAIQDKSEVTPKLLAALRKAQDQVVSEAGAADADLVKTYQADAQAVETSGTFTDAQQQQLKADYTAVLQSAGVSDATITALFAAQDAVKAASHVTSDDVQLLAADQKAVQTLLDAQPSQPIAFNYQGRGGAADAAMAGGLGGVYMNAGAPSGAVTTSVQPATITPGAQPVVVSTAAPDVTTTAVAQPVSVSTGAVPTQGGVHTLPAGVTTSGFSVVQQNVPRGMMRRLATRSGGGRSQTFTVANRSAVNNPVSRPVAASQAGVLRATPAAARRMSGAPTQGLSQNPGV